MDMPATTIQEAIAKWERTNKMKATDATEIGLQFQWPPIEKMDDNLSTLTKCEVLSLSSNMIEKISGLHGLKNLRILSLGRNEITSLAGVEAVGGTLEELWMSYNNLESTKGIESLSKLKILYLSCNLIKSWEDWTRLKECPLLLEVSFMENPLNEDMEEEDWRNEAIKRLPQLQTLDGDPVILDISSSEEEEEIVAGEEGERGQQGERGQGEGGQERVEEEEEEGEKRDEA